MANVSGYRRAYLLRFTVLNQPLSQLETHYWTGNGELDFDVGEGAGVEQWQGTEFNETALLELAPMQSTAEGVPSKIQGRIAIGNLADVQRNAVLERDLGPLPVSVYLLSRNPGTRAWTRTRTFRGRTGRSSLVDGMWEFAIEARNNDADRQRVGVWSHENQIKKKFTVGTSIYKGDRFFEFMQDLANSQPVAWPR